MMHISESKYIVGVQYYSIFFSNSEANASEILNTAVFLYYIHIIWNINTYYNDLISKVNIYTMYTNEEHTITYNNIYNTQWYIRTYPFRSS